MRQWRWAARRCNVGYEHGWIRVWDGELEPRPMSHVIGGSRTLDGAWFIDPPVVHFDEPIATIGEATIMSGHQESDAFVGGHIEKKLEHRGAGVLVERAGGLVGEKNFGVVHQRAADGGALALAAGEFLNLLIQAMGEAGALGEMLQALVGEHRDSFRRRPWE